jgi:hypothetical protein
MSQEVENYLSLALKKLEDAYEKVIKTTGYNDDAENIKVLSSFLNEQVEKHEDTLSSPR